ncbi:RNA-directed DNA polymerase from mobile element jockey [Trichonephila clavipes]|nr:RNA-directed DNA polymerase from mobile element jockey [Trichonephila clavipes]
MRLTGAAALNTPTTQRRKIKVKTAQRSRKMFHHLKTTPQAPRPDISKARKVSPNLDYSKVVQNLIPREHIGFWNANSLRNKIHEVRDFVNEQNFDSFLVQETRLEPAFVEASKPKFKNVPKILSPEIKSKIHQRNRLRKFWQRSRCPSIYSEFCTLSREIAKDIKSHSQAQWEKHIEALSPEDNTLWRKSSLLRKPFRSIPPLKGALGSTAITPIEKAEVIADSLQEQFEPNHVADREVFDQRIHEEVANFLATPHVQEIEPTTPTEVLTYVQRIKPKKSPGLDQISNRMLKNLSLKFLLFITLLINQLFKKNYFPDSWKTAVVIPILKPDKNPELAQNYRPISLLSCLSKVYEFVLLQRLNQHCAAANFIIPQQCGFRPKCSTVHQLLRVTELIHSGFAKHEATGILFLDIAKAFDKISHEGLLIKLIRLDFPAPLIKSIHSFLIHRSFRVRVDRILSSPRPIRSGLPQGSLSSPLLFTLYVNDIPQTDSSHLAMFADDTAVISQNKRFSVVISNLQHYISSLELWLNDWKIKVNASKSACLMFTRRSQLPVGLTPVTIFGQPVPWVNVARYLGLFLDAKLTFAYHIEQTRKKALAVHAMLKRLISRRSKLAIRHKVLLYKSIIRPVMCYGSQIFGSAGMCHLKKLHTLTNSFLRQLVNTPWFVRNEVIYRDLKIKPFLPHIKDLSKRFFDKLPSVPNEFIINQSAYDPAEPSSQKRPRALLEHEFINFPQVKRLRVQI